MISRWAQELLGYHYSVLHRSACMMIDVDALKRRFGNLTAQYIQVSSLLSLYDRQQLPNAYLGDLTSVLNPTKILMRSAVSSHCIPILIADVIQNATNFINCDTPDLIIDTVTALLSVPILLHPDHPRSAIPQLQVESASNTSKRLMKGAVY